MANKWRTAIADGLWVKEAYSDDPQNPSAKILVRAIYGLSRKVSDNIVDALNAIKSITNPVVNGAVISGTFRVIKNELRPSSDGNLAGSDTVIQTLGQGYFTTLSASNRFLLKNIYSTEPQNENSWMYYEWGTILETSRWVNLSSTTIESLFPYITDVSFSTTRSTFCAPIVHENWYEKEQDGSYSMYRSLFARSLTNTVRYRDRKYSGAIVIYRRHDYVGSPPVLGDRIYLSGFRNTSEIIYVGTKFYVDGNVYTITTESSVGNIFAGEAYIGIKETGLTNLYFSPTLTDDTLAKMPIPASIGTNSETLPVTFAAV